MFDPRTKLSEQVVEEVRRFFGDLVYDVIIPRTVRLSEAPGFGQPITVYDPKSKGAETYRELGAEVARRPPPAEPMPVDRRPPDRGRRRPLGPTGAPPEPLEDGPSIDEAPTVHDRRATPPDRSPERRASAAEPAPEPAPEPEPEPEPAPAPSRARRPSRAGAEPEPRPRPRRAGAGAGARTRTPTSRADARPLAQRVDDEDVWEDADERRRPSDRPRSRRTARPRPAPGHLPERRVVVIDEDADLRTPASRARRRPSDGADDRRRGVDVDRRDPRGRGWPRQAAMATVPQGRRMMSKRGGLGRGLSALIPGAPEAGEAAGLLEVPVNAVAPNPKQPRTRFDDEAIDVARGVDPRGRDPAADRGPAHRRRRLRADRGGAAAARGEGRRPGHGPGRGRATPSDADTAARGADREHPPRGPQPDRAGRGVPAAARRSSAQAGGARRPGRCVAVTHREHDPAAAALRSTSSSSSPTGRSRPATPARCCRSASRGDDHAGAAGRGRGPVGARDRGGGPALRRRRRQQATAAPRPRTPPRHATPSMAEVEEILSEQLATRVQIQMGAKRGQGRDRVRVAPTTSSGSCSRSSARGRARSEDRPRVARLQALALEASRTPALAERMMRVAQIARSDIPAACAAIGSRDVSVMPGRDVHLEDPGLAVGVDDRVDPRHVAQAQRRRRAQRALAYRRRRPRAQPRRREVLRGAGRVARRVVVHAALRHDLDQRQRPRAASPTSPTATSGALDLRARRSRRR